MKKAERFLRKHKVSFIAIVLLAAVISGRILWSRQDNEDKGLSTSEAVQETVVEIGGNEAKTEDSNSTDNREADGMTETDNAEAGTEASNENDIWFIPQASDWLITESEKEELQAMAVSAAELAKDVYRDVEILDSPFYGTNIREFTDEQRKEVVQLLGDGGFVSVTEDVDMENYEEIEAFYSAYLAGQDAMVTVFDVQSDGYIGAMTFIYREERLQSCYVGVAWQEGGIPEVRETVISNIAEIKLTEKGYFIYAYETVIAHASLRQGWRIKPLSESCRALTKKYISGLSFLNYNMLITNWDSSNVEEILMPGLFDDLYRMYTGENFKAENNIIPAELYEKVMMTYLPVSKEVLRKVCGYDESKDAYSYDAGYFRPYQPFGEVVDYEENADGTITLIVDGVWADYNSDCAFTNTIVVQPSENGTFRYLSNSIEKKELELPVAVGVKTKSEAAVQQEKGYDLYVDEKEREEAEDDCEKVMQLILDIYKQADKGESSNVVLSEETVKAMQDEVKETGYPVTTTLTYSDMENYEVMEAFFTACAEEEASSVITYDIHTDGSIGRNKFIFDGKDMYVLSTGTAWNEKNKPVITYTSYTRIENWRYTEKGWFCYELCVPKPPEVSEVVDGSQLMRVKPIEKEKRELSEKCVCVPGYQGNNLLCSDWNVEHMENLDYNGLYEYFYVMKYQKKFELPGDANGIPKEEFEQLIMEYLPVTEEHLREYAAFDEAHQTYAWEPIGCLNYAPTFLGTAVPEVTDIRENADGTMTLTVDAVCDTVLRSDALISHELTVRFAEDGSFQYLGNKILEDGSEYIPDYQYRISQ